MKKIIFSILLIAAIIPAVLLGQTKKPVIVGSKKFTESVILADITAQLAGLDYPNVVNKQEIGGTRVLWNALIKGDIDVYPEYTGTIKEEIFASGNMTDGQMRDSLRKLSIMISRPLGFNDTYAIGMKQSLAEKLGIKTISDLKRHPDLKFGFSNEFMDRKDGWPGLRNAYKLPQKNVTGLDHDLAYRGIDDGSIDVVDLYSTDAEIKYYHLRVLKDDLGYFPEYNAVLLYKSGLIKTAPEAVHSFLRLEGAVPESAMTEMNARAKIDKIPEQKIAADFINQNFGVETEFKRVTFFSRLLKNTREHLFMVIISLTAAILVSVPLGMFASRNKKAAGIILGTVGIIQTIPSLALLVFMIPLIGIGSWPAIVALFLYSLLPIVRNTYSGLEDIPLHIKESAEVLGLPSGTRLRLIELPIASRSILAGIKTSAVINVGTATLGALIGAGGYGQPILTGIRLDDVSLILQGAVPAAVLALLVQWMFDLIEIFIVPEGMRK